MPSGPSPKGKKGTITTDESTRFEPSSGNVFADLAIPNPGLALVKAELVQHIRKLISEQNLSQTQAGHLLKLDQPKVSLLLRGQVQGYTIDRLVRFLNALGQQVEISVRPANSSTAAISARAVIFG